MINRLFAYGTLRKECRDSKFRLFNAQARLLDFARLRGRLVDLGKYPGLVPTRNADDWVRGEVYVLDRPAKTLLHIDEYEGCTAEPSRAPMFRRVIGQAVLDSGREVSAWVYVYEGPVPRNRLIATGDYLHRTDSS